MIKSVSAVTNYNSSSCLKKSFYLNVQYFFLIVSQEVKKSFITVVHIMSGHILFFTSCNGHFKCHLYLKYVILLWQSMSARSNFEPWALDMPQNSDQMTNCLTLHNILGLMCHQNLWYRAQCFHQYNVVHNKRYTFRGRSNFDKQHPNFS